MPIMLFIRRFALPALALFLFAACTGKPDPEPPASGFNLSIYNDFSLLDARFAVFLSDENGLIRAFRWLPDQDSAQVTLPEAATSHFDCTVVKITTLLAPGSGVRDTTVTLTTYTHLASGGVIRLRDLAITQTTDLFLHLTNLQLLDSIVVPDGLTFVRPGPDNNFQGQFRVQHTGRFWLRMKIDGAAAWRYARFDNVNAPQYSATLDAATLPVLAAPAPLQLPFLANWQYQLDWVIDSAQARFLAIGDSISPPGSAVPLFDGLEVYEPPGPAGQGYRLRLSGTDPDPAGYGYTCDRFFATLPPTAPPLDFDLLPTVLADNRLVAVQCDGAFDLLAFARSRSGTPHLNWEVQTQPSAGNVVVYRLPDVPAELAALFPRLGAYDFGGQVQARAEAYDQLSSYDAVVERRLRNDDPLWQMKAGYVARERVFH